MTNQTKVAKDPTAFTAYGKWLSAQTPQQIVEHFEHLELSTKLGDSQRRSPFSEETKALIEQVKAYYAQHKEGDDNGKGN